MSAGIHSDILIVGGGIAGSSLAISLSAAGLDVHLVERVERFRDRVRGEMMHPWGVTQLRALGQYRLAIRNAGAVEHPIWQKYALQQVESSYRWSADFPHAPNTLGFSHVRLQNSLIAEAARTGVKIHRPAEVTCQRAGERLVITIHTGNDEIVVHPRLLVGADGEHSATRRWLGGNLHPDPVHHMLGGVLVEGLGLAEDRVHQAYFEGGFAFASPTGNDRLRVFLVCSPELATRIQLSDNPADGIVEQFCTALPASIPNRSWRAIGPAAFFPNSTLVATIPKSADTILIGDASGRNDPTQGHGLSLVFRDVRTLRDALLSGSPWHDIPDWFHSEKAREFHVLRQHAKWNERTATETGPEIDAIRQRMERSRGIDPTAGGFAGIFALGPAGLVADERAERHFMGAELDVAAERETAQARSSTRNRHES